MDRQSWVFTKQVNCSCGGGGRATGSLPSRLHWLPSPNKLPPIARSVRRLPSPLAAAAVNTNGSCVVRENHRDYVHWFREAWPYIQGHRGSTFVIVVPGEILAKRETLDNILQDVSLLHGLGIQIVLVPGVRVQIDDLLRERGREPRYVGAYRITDAHALDASMEAAGKLRVEIEAKLSRGPSIPVLRRHGENGRWHESGLGVASGNFLSAKRRGVVNGVDFGATGEVKKIDAERIKERLDKNCIVLMSNLGYSSTGEVLNCNTYEVATACAVALQADKLLCLLDSPVLDENGFLIRFMTLPRADQLIRQRASQSYIAADYVKALAGSSYVKSLGLADVPFPNERRGFYVSASTGDLALSEENYDSCGKGFAVGGLVRTQGYLSELTASVHVCRAGVRRVHLLDGTIEGALLLELYTRDGIGTMIASDMYEGIRCATKDDLQDVEKLLRPLEESGILVKRSREKLRGELEHYVVVEREGSLIACCALYPFLKDKCAEVGAFAVSPECRGHGQGDSLLDYVEQKAAAMDCQYLFLLTTRAADWFVSRGFFQCPLEQLPAARRSGIDFTRGSKYYMKSLQPRPCSSAQLALQF
ncbi:hypothetical protein SELMODRAFT_175390 [Selaginella moellendorffii]|uniref:amino-acid N-acetyltransferase n=2 Tax=Selaginella moellendorffii TaxID=88036 RepID=D8RY95_SELML|nr:hypothetical protein SELMODRAFT_175390 [Selaginella moellendorffii]